MTGFPWYSMSFCDLRWTGFKKLQPMMQMSVLRSKTPTCNSSDSCVQMQMNKAGEIVVDFLTFGQLVSIC